jgi:chromosome transmission fidelity protein 18
MNVMVVMLYEPFFSQRWLMKNFVRVLLDLIHSDEKAGGPAPKSAKGKKKQRKPLLRPIICICNDLYFRFLTWINWARYATALRPLRPYCHILHVRPSPPSSLLPRLQKICHLENIKAEARALTLLVDSHDGDLRSCINTLQLLATRCDNLSLSFVQESLLKAKKEGSLTSHTVVEGVFARRTARERRRLNLTAETEGQRVVNDVNACGELDRIMSGMSQ